MNNVVLDASALLALLNGEPGADKLSPELLSVSTSSTVSVAEVQSKLVDKGLSTDDAWEAGTCSEGPRLHRGQSAEEPEIRSANSRHPVMAADLPDGWLPGDSPFDHDGINRPLHE
jgi:uncharacterized protein with PIN domain